MLPLFRNKRLVKVFGLRKYSSASPYSSCKEETPEGHERVCEFRTVCRDPDSQWT